MDVKHITPFLEAARHVLQQVGNYEIQRGRIGKKDGLQTSYDVTTIIGLSRGLRGSVAYSMSEETAKEIASKMMFGMPVSQFDEMAKSAIGELANMISGNAMALFASQEMAVDLTPPTLVNGKDLTVSFRRGDTIMVELLTPAGVIEVNIGLEIV